MCFLSTQVSYTCTLKIFSPRLFSRNLIQFKFTTSKEATTVQLLTFGDCPLVELYVGRSNYVKARFRSAQSGCLSPLHSHILTYRPVSFRAALHFSTPLAISDNSLFTTSDHRLPTDTRSFGISSFQVVPPQPPQINSNAALHLTLATARSQHNASHFYSLSVRSSSRPFSMLACSHRVKVPWRPLPVTTIIEPYLTELITWQYPG